eukprot:Skav204365  [mRNA]  locus=scaffold866:87015:89777:+ [translate_table: standard]
MAQLTSSPHLGDLKPGGSIGGRRGEGGQDLLSRLIRHVAALDEQLCDVASVPLSQRLRERLATTIAEQEKQVEAVPTEAQKQIARTLRSSNGFQVATGELDPNDKSRGTGKRSTAETVLDVFTKDPVQEEKERKLREQNKNQQAEGLK